MLFSWTFSIPGRAEATRRKSWSGEWEETQCEPRPSCRALGHLLLPVHPAAPRVRMGDLGPHAGHRGCTKLSSPARSVPPMSPGAAASHPVARGDLGHRMYHEDLRELPRAVPRPPRAVPMCGLTFYLPGEQWSLSEPHGHSRDDSEKLDHRCVS